MFSFKNASQEYEELLTPAMENKGRKQRHFLMEIHAILFFNDKHWHLRRSCLLKLCESLKENETFCHGNSASANPDLVDSI